MPDPVHAVNQQNVLPTITVVIEKGASCAHRFREKFAAIGATVVQEADSGARGDIDQTKSGSSLGRRGCRPGISKAHARSRSQTPDPQEKRPAIHGRLTSPLRMA